MTSQVTQVAQSAPAQENKPIEHKPSDKELNFRRQEMMYEKKLAEQDAKLRELEQRLQDKHQSNDSDDDESDEPYVDHKKLAKKLNRFGEQTKKQTQSDIQNAVQQAIYEERKQNWLENHKDFYDVMQHATKFAEKNPRLAETILKMPESFERQQLVYDNIKALGLDKPEQKEPTIQDKIDANKRMPYYQPSGIGAAPYAAAGDFSPTGQKNAYSKMQELKARLRL